MHVCIFRYIHTHFQIYPPTHAHTHTHTHTQADMAKELAKQQPVILDSESSSSYNQHNKAHSVGTQAYAPAQRSTEMPEKQGKNSRKSSSKGHVEDIHTEVFGGVIDIEGQEMVLGADQVDASKDQQWRDARCIILRFPTGERQKICVRKGANVTCRVVVCLVLVCVCVCYIFVIYVCV